MAFNARALHELKSDVLYRVYARADAISFVKVEGQGLDHVWTALFGAKRASRFGRKSREKREASIAELDAGDPAGLAVRNARNFTARVDQIRTTSIDPAKRIPWHGTHVALWRIQFDDGRRLVLQFESQDDLQSALAELRAVLGDRLTVSV